MYCGSIQSSQYFNGSPSLAKRCAARKHSLETSDQSALDSFGHKRLLGWFSVQRPQQVGLAQFHLQCNDHKVESRIQSFVKALTEIQICEMPRRQCVQIRDGLNRVQEVVDLRIIRDITYIEASLEVLQRQIDLDY
jgi:hypothetical protein